MFKVEIKADVLKELKKMDKQTSAYLFNWINHNLVNIKNPRIIGKALKGEYKGFWRYRAGKFRIIAKIKDKVLTIEIIKIAKRDGVYNK